MQFVYPSHLKEMRLRGEDHVHNPAADPDHQYPERRSRVKNPLIAVSSVPDVQSETAMAQDRVQTNYYAVVLIPESRTWVDLKVD
jgi:hypothetical protein